MRYLKSIWEFCWPFLRRYQGRLLAGVLLGVLFGLSNASFIWATKTLFERMDPTMHTTSVEEPKKKESLTQKMLPGQSSAVLEKLKGLNGELNDAIDPWLPKRGRSADWKQLLGGFLFLPVLVFARGMLGYLSTYCMCWVSERVLSDLRIHVLNKLQSLSLDYFNRSTTGDLMTRINGDTGMIHRCLLLGFGDLIKEPMSVVFAIIALCFVSWKLTLIAFIFLPACLLPMRIFGKKARKATQAGYGASVSQSSLLVEIISGIRVVKTFGLEEKQMQRFQRYSREQIHHGMKWIQARELINPVIETLAMLGLGLLIVYIVYTNTSVPELISFLTGVVMCFTPIKKLAGLHVMFQQTSVGVDRLMTLFAEKPSVKEPENPQPVAKFSKALEFNGVNFSYGEKLVIKDLNLKVPLGYKLGIAGESGSGKSTLANLIFRFYDPVGGNITLDGLDLRHAKSFDLRAQMALVSQEIVLFDLTVAENIACGKPGATRAEIETAARAAHAHDFIMQMEQGYDSRIGERGVKLSGGQRQRVCIARAFVRNAPILVLDEATASLDSQSESEVQVAIDQLAENRTVVSIAHRLSTLKNMNHIIVLSEGRIVEQGTFEELLRKNGIFAAMARQQEIKAREDVASA